QIRFGGGTGFIGSGDKFESTGALPGLKTEIIGRMMPLITQQGDRFYMTRWPSGLPGHDDPTNTLRFPHGLMRFGESLDDCATRLVGEQLGMKVNAVEILYWDSYVDDYDHWHIESGCLVEVEGTPKLPEKASEVVTFTIDNVPKMTFWPKSEFIEAVKCKLN
ncbi:MAG: NUDIX domain-containing protein, partial [Bacteroidetes bacterium]|nr:NUDIX domain-containing protein [Bacteroidota bacterium]